MQKLVLEFLSSWMSA